MHQIIDGLFIGDLQDASDLDYLKKHGITHILTVINDSPLEKAITETLIGYKFFCCYDLESVDLLTKFMEGIDFIAGGLENGRVLVHCFMGVSRSATFVLAYLMNKRQISLSDGLSMMKQKRAHVRPNDGFMAQLQLFEEMGSKIDPRNDRYRCYKLNQLSLKVRTSLSNEEVKLKDLLTENPSDSAAPVGETIYKCRKCRQTLFKHSLLLSHNEGEGEAAFDWRAKMPVEKRRHLLDYSSSAEESKPVCDKSLFIEPVRWMADFITSQEGKIPCPKCESKIGSFIWYGEKCPCGTWVAPAFHIQSSKVDVCPPLAITPKKAVAVVAPMRADGTPIEHTECTTQPEGKL